MGGMTEYLFVWCLTPFSPKSSMSVDPDCALSSEDITGVSSPVLEPCGTTGLCAQ